MSRSSSPRLGLAVGLPLAVAVVVTWTCCTRVAPAPKPAAEGVVAQKIPPKLEPTPNPLDILGGAEPDKPVVFLLPELPFEERSEGLPKSGTWRGTPLLHDFTGDGLADI